MSQTQLSTRAPTRAPVVTAWRRHRSSLLIAAALVFAVGVTIVAGISDSGRTAANDPDNPGPDGSQALARVLADQGVDVEVVRSAAALAAARVDADTTIVVTSPRNLGAGTADGLQQQASGAAELVLVAPTGPALELFDVDLSPMGVAPGERVSATCSDPTYGDLAIESDTAIAYATDSGCFPVTDGNLLVQQGSLTVFGAAEAWTNDQILRADNAASALRGLGSTPRLVWYVPSTADLSSAEDGVTVSSLLPPWIRPGLWLLAVTAVLLVVWRSRRLGPLAVEPLPVVVQALETTRSRGRLYRRSGDTGHAARALRRATRRRLARRLNTDPAAPEETLVAAVATHLGRPTREIEALLGTTAPAPRTDHDLIHLAERLAALEEEVRTQ